MLTNLESSSMRLLGGETAQLFVLIAFLSEAIELEGFGLLLLQGCSSLEHCLQLAHLFRVLRRRPTCFCEAIHV